MLDVEPADPRCKYEPQFKEEAKNVFDNNGNQVKDNKGNSGVFQAPKLDDMWKYNKDIKRRQDNFKREVFACIKQ